MAAEGPGDKESAAEARDRSWRQRGGWLVWIGMMVFDHYTGVDYSSLEGWNLYFKVATYGISIFLITGVTAKEVAMMLRELVAVLKSATELVKAWRGK